MERYGRILIIVSVYNFRELWLERYGRILIIVTVYNFREL